MKASLPRPFGLSALYVTSPMSVSRTRISRSAGEISVQVFGYFVQICCTASGVIVINGLMIAVSCGW